MNYKIAILTTFQEFNPGFSLSGIVQDQSRMLLSYGHEVHIFVSDQFDSKKYPALPEGDFERYGLPKDKFKVVPEIPFTHLIDYRTVNDLTADHKMTVNVTSERLIKELASFDYVFTHDFIFTGWNLPYALGIRKAGHDEKLKHLRWFDWIHSMPSSMFDWWNIRAYGPRHRIIFPNKTESTAVAEQFRGLPNNVRVIPHIKDPRSWWEFDQSTCEFLKEYPEIMDSQVMQVYPASSDRLTAKRLEVVLKIFSEIKKRKLNVFLVIANQWATGTQPRENIDHYMKVASRNGLKISEDFTFTSSWKPETENGIPKRMVRELFLLSNLFVYPTREESFGLIAPEAGLSGVLMVNNKSLDMMMEVNGLTGMYADFGSFRRKFNPENEDAYLTDIATLILSRMQRNEAIQSKTWHRRTYNWDTLYRKYYEPIMSEAKYWA